MTLAGDLRMGRLRKVYEVTTPEIPQPGDIEIEAATSYSQTVPPGEGWGHQPTYKTFTPNFVLLTKCTRIKMEQRLRE